MSGFPLTIIDCVMRVLSTNSSSTSILGEGGGHVLEFDVLAEF